MASVSTMVLRSLRMTGEKHRGATLTSDEQTELLAEFNTFMDACANERLLCYQIQDDALALSAGVSSYTIGTNGTFAVTRPTKIVDPCFVRDSSNFDSPVKVIGPDAFGSIKNKSVGNSYPTHLYYDYGYSNTSTGTIFLFPSPVASLTLHIGSWKQLGTVSTLSQNVNLPPGYQLFIESNFAIHTAAGVLPVSPELAKIARDSKAAIKGLNVPDTVMRLESGVLPGYRGASNIITGP